MLSWVKYHEYYAVVPHGEGTMIRPVPFQLVRDLAVSQTRTDHSGLNENRTSSERRTTSPRSGGACSLRCTRKRRSTGRT